MKKFNIIILLFFCSINNLLFGQANENALKAGYIEKFARFTNWPMESETETDTFYITVIGKNEINSELNKIAKKYPIKNKNVKIKYITDLKDFNNKDITHLLFISSSEDNQLALILKAIKNKPILTVGETDKCAKLGVHFVFFENQGETLHFKVNPKKIKESGLETDIYLMNYGEIINN